MPKHPQFQKGPNLFKVISTLPHNFQDIKTGAKPNSITLVSFPISWFSYLTHKRTWPMFLSPIPTFSNEGGQMIRRIQPKAVPESAAPFSQVVMDDTYAHFAGLVLLIFPKVKRYSET